MSVILLNGRHVWDYTAATSGTIKLRYPYGRMWCVLLLEGQQHHGRLAITVLASGVTSQQRAQRRHAR